MPGHLSLTSLELPKILLHTLSRLVQQCLRSLVKEQKKKKIILESADGDSSMPMLVNVNGSLTMESQSSKLHAAILTLRILLQRFQDLTPRQMPCCLLLRSTRCSISGTDVWNRCVPFTQRLSLGWVIVGNICHGGPNKCS